MTPRRSLSRLSLLPAGVVLALVLSGCVPEGAQPGPTGSPSGSPSAGGQPTPLVVVPCADLLSRADIDRLVGAEAVAADLDEADVESIMPSAAAADALASASSATGCRWAEPQDDTGVRAVVADITPAQAATLRAAIVSDPSFTSESTAGAEVFSTGGEDAATAIVLLGSAWVTAAATGVEQARDTALQLLDTLRSLNPGLPAAPTQPSEEPEPSASPTPSPSPTPSSSPGAPDASAVLPACGELLPIAVVRDLFADAAEPLKATGSPADHMPGPLAASTVREASQSRMCTWGIPFSDGGFSVVTAQMAAPAQARLLSSLRSAQAYTERAIDGEPAFTYSAETELGTTTVVYVFVGDVWITVNGTLDIRTGRALAREAMDAVRLAGD